MTADTYTHGHHDAVLRSHRWRTVDNSAAYLLEHLKPGTDLLDVGCGPGTLTADLARRVAPGGVVGIDAAAEVLTEARRTTADQPHVEIGAGDVYHLPFDADMFDVVHAHQVLQHLTEPVAALAEMGRVCRSEGIVAVRDADYRAMTWWPEDERLDRWMEIYQAVTRRNRAEPDAGRRLLSWALAAGFTDVRPTASVWCFATVEDRAWWGGLWAERVVNSDFAHQAVEYGMADRAELETVAEGWRQWSAAPDGWFSVMHGEIIARAA